MHVINTQFKISSVRSMRRPMRSGATLTRNPATPMKYTIVASAGPAIRRANRKKIAPAAFAAQAGQPACRKYRIAYVHAHIVDDGRVRMNPVKTGSPVVDDVGVDVRD